MYARSFSLKRLIAAMIIAALLCLGLALAGDPATAAVTKTTWVSPCGPPYRANGHESLREIAAFKAASPLSQVLEDTVFCARGKRFPPMVQFYINTSRSFNNPMPKGSKLWFSRLP